MTSIQLLHEALVKKRLSISTAESCTAGALAGLLASTPGSSQYFSGGIVTYQTQKKIEILGVDPEIIARHSVVSEEVAREMSEACQRLFSTDIAVATTGVAGPNKGEDGNDVGTLYCSIRIFDQEYSQKLFLPHLTRTDFVNTASQNIISMLVDRLE